MVPARRFWNMERSLILLFLVVCAAMVINAQSFPDDARRFPQLVASLVGILAGYLLIGQFVAWRQNRGPSQPAGRAPFLPWTSALALSVGGLLAIVAFGIGTGMLIFITVTATRLGLRRHLALVYGVLFSVLIWYTFGTLLRIPLPEGILIPLY